ncbi:MAG TPA: hypothetical protein VGD91_28315 [Trebonia sp.]
MTGTVSPQGAPGTVPAAGAFGGPRPTLRRGPRLALLSAAVAILLLGAVIAGVFGYLLISRGSAGV